MTSAAQANVTRLVHVVFVHGLFASTDTWDEFCRVLAGDSEAAGVVAHRFSYGSPFVRLQPDRAIAEYDDIADRLATYLSDQIPKDGPIVLVSHSQGGLIIQRFLARTVRESLGPSLARIKGVIMFACPNNGSGFFLTLRRSMVFFWRNPQVKQLEPYQREVLETQRTVVRAIVHAKEDADGQWHIPIWTYGGAEDGIVPAREARGIFPDGGVVDGDHHSVVRPAHRDAASYCVVRAQLLPFLQGGAPEASAAHGLPEQRSVEAPVAGSPLAVGGSVDLPVPEPSIANPPEPLLPQQQGGVSVTPPYGRRQGRLQGSGAAGVVRAVLGQHTEGSLRIHVLTGLGGSGKSRTALEVAFQASRSRRVWWVTVPRINSCMREVANQLDVPSGEIEQAFNGNGSSMDLVWRYLEACPDPWLLVIDNADTSDRLAPQDSLVSDGTGWVRQPVRADGLVVVTSRDRSASSWLPPCEIHQVLPLNDQDGADLLQERAPRGGSSEDARALSRALGGLPLALHGAAAYVNSVSDPTLSLDDPTIRDFATYREAFQARRASPPGTPTSGLDEILGFSIMREVCGIALELLAQQGLQQSDQLLRAFACLGIAPIPYRVLLKSQALLEFFPGFTQSQRNAVLRGLGGLGLVEMVSRPEAESTHLVASLSLHPVVHALLRGDEDVVRRRAEYYGLNVNLLLDVTSLAPPDVPASWDLWTAVAPHAMEVVKASLIGPDHIGDVSVIRDALELARLTARYLIIIGLLGPAQELVGPITDNCADFGFRPDDREILGLRHERGRIALESGDHVTAEAELRVVVVDRQRVLGPDDPFTLASRHKLARSILEQGRFVEAEPLLRSIAEAELDLHGPQYSDTITVQHSWARALFALGRRQEAEAVLREILATSLATGSQTSTETLRIRQTLARCLLEMQRPDDAEKEIREALRDAPQGAESPLALSLCFTLCQVLLIQGRIAEATSEAEGLLDHRKDILGPDHAETRRTERLLARIRSIPDPAA